MIQVGDTVTRMLNGTIPMKLKVSKIDDRFIHCGPWKFDKTYGYEVDEDLGWGMQTGGPRDGEVVTGSFLKLTEG